MPKVGEGGTLALMSGPVEEEPAIYGVICASRDVMTMGQRNETGQHWAHIGAYLTRREGWWWIISNDRRLQTRNRKQFDSMSMSWYHMIPR